MNKIKQIENLKIREGIQQFSDKVMSESDNGAHCARMEYESDGRRIEIDGIRGSNNGTTNEWVRL